MYTPHMCEQAQIIQVLGSITPEDLTAMPCTDGWITGDPMPVPLLVRKAWHDALQVTLTAGHTASAPYGSEFEGILSSLLCWQPAARFSAEQVLVHPFFATQIAEH